MTQSRFEQLIKNLIENATSLQSLDLEGTGSNYMDEADIHRLAEALKVNSRLQHLDLNSNAIGDKGAMSIAKALKVNTGLQNLNLGWNKISGLGAMKVAGELIGNNALKHLVLNGNGIGDVGAISLALLIKENTMMQSLYLPSNRIGDAGAIRLAEALKKNTTLKVLDLNFNETNDISVSVFDNMLSQNYTLLSLGLQDSNLGIFLKLKRNKRIQSLLSLIDHYTIDKPHWEDTDILNGDEIQRCITKLEHLIPKLTDQVEFRFLPAYIIESYRFMQVLAFLSLKEYERALTELLKKPFVDFRLQKAVAQATTHALMVTEKFNDTSPKAKQARYLLLAYSSAKVDQVLFKFALISTQQSQSVTPDQLQQNMDTIIGADVILDYTTILDLGKQALRQLSDSENEYWFLLTLLKTTTYDSYTTSLFWQSPMFQKKIKARYPDKTTFRLLEDCLLHPSASKGEKSGTVFNLNETMSAHCSYDANQVKPRAFQKLMQGLRHTLYQVVIEPTDLIKEAAENYLQWMKSINIKQNKGIAKWRISFHHFFHGAAGYNRVQRLLRILSDPSKNDTEKMSATIAVFNRSGNHKHSFSRFLYKALSKKDEHKTLKNIHKITNAEFAKERDGLLSKLHSFINLSQTHRPSISN